MNKKDKKRGEQTMKTLEEIRSHLENMKEENVRAIQECDDSIKNLEQEIGQADIELVRAEKEGDAEAYAKAKDDKRTATDVKELRLKQKEKHLNEPLVTKEEYNQLLSTITKTATAIGEVQFEEASKLIEPLKDLASEIGENWSEANELIRLLQYDVYKDDDKVVLVNGNAVSTPQQYKNNKVQWFANKVKALDEYIKA